MILIIAEIERKFRPFPAYRSKDSEFIYTVRASTIQVNVCYSRLSLLRLTETRTELHHYRHDGDAAHQ